MSKPNSPLKPVERPAYQRYRLRLEDIGLGHLRPGDFPGSHLLDRFRGTLRAGDVVEIVGRDFEVEVAVSRYMVDGHAVVTPVSADFPTDDFTPGLDDDPSGGRLQ
ncbi:hypothetical protein [Rhodomicrobium sp.]|uniref:hypothetical protein n=1 Tax=Rhodomicrobium sp. TaxID=2720632 RepID=UPI0039E348DC